MRTALILTLLALLTACGGGDPEPEEADARIPVPSVQCERDPRLCV